MKSWAKQKWDLWLKDASQYLNNLKDESLIQCHRMWLGYLRKRIREAAPDSDEGRQACLELLQSKGLVNAASCGHLSTMQALLTDLCDMGYAVRQAASNGHTDCVLALIACKADELQCTS